MDNRHPSVYDAASNLLTATYPNQVQQTLSYDALNRITQSGAASRSYAYNRAVTGRVLSVGEVSGRIATYSYDSVLRLTNETITADPAGKSGTLAYSLDAVTNRLSLTSALSGFPSQTFTFNANDQTTGDIYDANGNVLASGATATSGISRTA